MTRLCSASLFRQLYLPLSQREEMSRVLRMATAQESSWTDRLDSIIAGKVLAMAEGVLIREAPECSVNLAKSEISRVFHRPKELTLEANTEEHSLKTICFNHHPK